jgi:hypothetical protein
MAKQMTLAQAQALGERNRIEALKGMKVSHVIDREFYLPEKERRRKKGLPSES